MQFLLVTILGVAIPLTSALPTTAQGTHELNIVLQRDKTTSDVSIGVWNKDRSELIAHACDESLGSGEFEDLPISFAVDPNSNGTVTIGSTSYLIHENPEYSGGISCNRIYSQTESLVTCAVEVPAAKVNLSARATRDLSKRDVAACFRGGNYRLSGVLEGFTNPETTTQLPAYTNTSAPAPGPLDKRQWECGQWTQGTYRVGDGNPHQNPLNIQLSVRFLTLALYRIEENLY